LADLLRDRGYRVSKTNSVVRPIADDALAIALVTNEHDTNVTDPVADANNPFRSFASKFVADGGTLLLAYIDAEMMDRTKDFTEKIERSDDLPQKLTISKQEVGDFNASNYSETDPYVSLWFNESDEDICWTTTHGEGTITYLASGMAVTNHLISRHDNAAYALDVIDAAANGRKKVVFLDSAFGSIHTESLAELIGPWFEGAWIQILVIFAIVVLALGIRFGRPDETRYLERGSRELVDAYSDVLARSRSSKVALEQVLKAADTELRRRFKIAIDANDEARDKMLPEDVVAAMTAAENAIRAGAPEDVMVATARRLDTALQQALGTSQRLRARKRRRT
jgi:hypothetical protein